MCCGASDGVFDDWRDVLLIIAQSGNAILISFIRSSPKFFAQIASQFSKNQSSAERKESLIATTRRVLQLTKEIAEIDAESALAAFRSSAAALRTSFDFAV